MNIDCLEYIKGQKFHSGLNFPIHEKESAKTNVVDRFSFLKESLSNKKILHIGCADHLNLIDKKRNAGIWIHESLSEISSECIGIDINRKAIDYIRDHLGITNVICADVTKKIPEFLLKPPAWDIVFLGEIIEHLNDPVAFLTILKNNIGSNANELVITAPNALRWQNFKNAQKGIECINSDHRYWFTPYTLSKILSEAGFIPSSFHFVAAYKINKPSGIRSYLNYRRLLKSPANRDTIVLRCSF
jgi:2-polyprenyl-3-methyl-5-hydroxy-6-metoxy-1,4-benzoquinol methylase